MISFVQVVSSLALTEHNSYVQSKITRREIASAAAIFRNSQASGKQQQSHQGNSNFLNKQRQPLSEEEKKRRTRFTGKCFRCGLGEHMQPNFPRPANISCNICKQSGHMSPACLHAAAAGVTHDQSSQPTYTVTYPSQQPQQQQFAQQHLNQQPLAVNYSDSVSAFTAHLHNLPTPQAQL